MYYQSEILGIIKKKYNIKNGDKITLKLIYKIAKGEKMDIKDVLCIFLITDQTWYLLRRKGQKYTTLKLDRIKKVKEIRGKENITYEEFKLIMEKLKVKLTTLIKMLGISRYSYNKMINGSLNMVRVKDMKAKHVIDLIRIDIRYLKQYGENKYYKKEEIENMCKKRRTTLDNFARYHDNNYRCYKFNKIAFKDSKKGFWIGGDEKIENEFITNNFQKVQKIVDIAITKALKLMPFYNFKDDLKQDAYIELVEKYGNIVKKFYFNESIMFNILSKKLKTAILRTYKNKYCKKEISYNDF